MVYIPACLHDTGVIKPVVCIMAASIHRDQFLLDTLSNHFVKQKMKTPVCTSFRGKRVQKLIYIFLMAKLCMAMKIIEGTWSCTTILKLLNQVDRPNNCISYYNTFTYECAVLYSFNCLA